MVLCCSDCASSIAPSSPIPLSVNPPSITCHSCSKPCDSTKTTNPPQTMLSVSCFFSTLHKQQMHHRLQSHSLCVVHNHHMTCQLLKHAHTTTKAPHHQCPVLSVLCCHSKHHTTHSHHEHQSCFLFPYPHASQSMAHANTSTKMRGFDKKEAHHRG